MRTHIDLYSALPITVNGTPDTLLPSDCPWGTGHRTPDPTAQFTQLQISYDLIAPIHSAPIFARVDCSNSVGSYFCMSWLFQFTQLQCLHGLIAPIHPAPVFACSDCCNSRSFDVARADRSRSPSSNVCMRWLFQFTQLHCLHGLIAPVHSAAMFAWIDRFTSSSSDVCTD